MLVPIILRLDAARHAGLYGLFLSVLTSGASIGLRLVPGYSQLKKAVCQAISNKLVYFNMIVVDILVRIYLSNKVNILIRKNNLFLTLIT